MKNGKSKADEESQEQGMKNRKSEADGIVRARLMKNQVGEVMKTGNKPIADPHKKLLEPHELAQSLPRSMYMSNGNCVEIGRTGDWCH
eukprot:CAMPEP_0175835838 /NCGR_PEP_ID=MMETSP0107_2-20121207/16815_1 /TAXON_ID=195067 ORGANISM="Goniomonas pacifica, Strain CCMP1869" /NCGR_SAMPLE_ID=MMETSP0107_2 /ASSEMBLY_ACC=CAM_ASM_000203 /LENGTH=87 /DNA_ID=CAMNT_0017149177 /DNA_START=225 /DNA_END=488 /DNA_ORIENTATION=+